MNSIKNITRQKMHDNWEYGREDILADNYVSIFNSHNFFHSNQLFELKSSTANTSLAKKAPKAYLESCQTNIFFAKTVNG